VASSDTRPEAAVVLLSGGLDSTTLLHHVVKRLGRAPVHVLSILYGQRHARELECARYQAHALAVAVHRVVDMAFLGDLIRPGSALIEGGSEVPNLEDIPADRLDQPPTYVPNRNMMLLAVAAAYAEAHGIGDVFYGAQAQDEYGYWDCTAAFIERLNAVLALNRGRAVQVHAPFVAMKKAEILHGGLELGVDYGRTWSCYRGGATACGTCPTCVERRAAFAANGVDDPLEYEDAPRRP